MTGETFLQVASGVLYLFTHFPSKAWTAVILCRNWSLFRKLSTQTSERELRLSSLIRVMLFTMMTTIGFG
jgi:hypothetical protein